MRYSIAALIGIGAIVAASSIARADKANEEPTMTDAAREAYVASSSLYEVGAAGVTPEAVYTWSKRWAEADADGAAADVRHKAYLAHSDRMKLLLSKVASKYNIAVIGGESDKYWAALYYKAEADKMLKNDAAAAKP